MFFHFMLEVELGVTNIASEIPLFFVNCLHVLFEIALAYKTSSTNLTDFHVLEKEKKILIFGLISFPCLALCLLSYKNNNIHSKQNYSALL